MVHPISSGLRSCLKPATASMIDVFITYARLTKDVAPAEGDDSPLDPPLAPARVGSVPQVPLQYPFTHRFPSPSSTLRYAGRFSSHRLFE